MKWVGHMARMGAMRNARNILVAKPEGKITLNIKAWIGRY
jgi:hypothetical protein